MHDIQVVTSLCLDKVLLQVPEVAASLNKASHVLMRSMHAEVQAGSWKTDK